MNTNIIMYGIILITLVKLHLFTLYLINRALLMTYVTCLHLNIDGFNFNTCTVADSRLRTPVRSQHLNIDYFNLLVL